jgi:membrane protein DedA with SNARE-associated domain
MIESFLNLLEQTAQSLPLPLFVLIGSLTEELISFIPSPFVLTLAGSLAKAQNSNLLYLVMLAAIAAVAKTAGSYVFYVLADKLEDLITGKFGKVFGLSHKNIEAIGKKLEKSSSDEVAIFLLRATPLIPSAPVSIVAGILKLQVKSYLLASAAGMFVRSLFFLYLGYTATGTISDVTNQLSSYETYGKIILLILATIGLVWFYRKRKALDS